MKLVRLVMILTLAGCADRDEPRVSLGGQQAQAAGVTGATGATAPNDAIHQGVKATGQQETGMLSPAAKAALDSGNTLYRAKKYEAALAAYRSAAKAAPNEAAPYFGIYMAAQALGLTKVQAEAQRKIGELSGDTSAVAPHAVPSTKKPPAAAQ